MCNVGDAERVRIIPRAKPIIAWRWWLYGAETGNESSAEDPAALRPIAYCDGPAGKTWEQRIAKADRAPAKYDGGGLYAFATREQAEDDDAGPERYSYAVLGSVALWGRVVICSKGYRAQHARVRSLDHAVAENTAVWSWEASSEANAAAYNRGEKAAKGRARRALARAQKQYRVKAAPKGRAAK